MKIPILDMKKQINGIRNEIDEAINSVFDSGSFVQGHFVEKFEEEFASAIGVKHAIACNSGTSALHLALLASGVKPGDEVIIPGMTFIATASAVIYAGAVPVIVDIESQNWLIDPYLIENAITDKTTAIMPVHLHGRTANLEAIKMICKKYKLLLIEDAAQAHLAHDGLNFVGSVGDAAGFSFYPGKNLGACGEGGIVTTNSDEIAHRSRLLRDWGAEKKYHHDFFGYNYRMDSIQGAILSVKLKHLENWTSLREIAYEKYKKTLHGSEYWLPQINAESRHVHHVLSTLVENRDEVLEVLNKVGINVACHYPKGLHEHKGLQGKIRVHEKLSNTEFFAKYNLSLPIFPEITDEEISFVCENLKSNSSAVNAR